MYYWYQERDGSVTTAPKEDARYAWFQTKEMAIEFGKLMYAHFGGLYSVGDDFDFYRYHRSNISKIHENRLF